MRYLIPLICEPPHAGHVVRSYDNTAVADSQQPTATTGTQTAPGGGDLKTLLASRRIIRSLRCLQVSPAYY